MEYALLNKEKTTLSLQLVWWWELCCRCWSIYVGILYTNTEFIFLLLNFNKVSRKAKLSITFFLHSKLNVWMKIVDAMKKDFQLLTFKNRINFIRKLFPTSWRVYCRRYCSLPLSLHLNFCCGWRCYCYATSLFVKLRIKSVRSGC